MDGFSPRRSIGGREQVAAESGLQPSFENSGLSHASDERELKGSSLTPQDNGGLSRAAIDESLGGIEDEKQPTKKNHRAHHISKKKLIKRSIIVVAILLLIGIGAFLAKIVLAGGSIFQGSVLGLVQSQPLKEDENGRSNILVFGTSEDDPSHVDGGPWLTDSLMVVSIDQTKHDAYTISIPRDLWVDYGQLCMAYEGKINALYQCHSNDGVDDAAGSKALSNKIGDVLGLDIQYYVHVNYGVVRAAVDAVDGIDVDIQGDPASAGGVLDRNFDWECNYTCYYVKYDNGVHHLDGVHALALARARGDVAPTYGLARSNFSREINQQKIMKALFAKATSVGTLTNVSKVLALIDAFGDNMRTNFDTSEIQTLVKIAQNTTVDSIQSIDIGATDNGLFTTDSSNVYPAAGTYDFSEIQAFVAKQLSSDPAVREEAQIGVYNGTQISGLAQSTSDELTAKDLVVVDVGNAEATTYTTMRIYDLTGGKKPATIKKLESLYGVTATQDAPPFTATGLDIVIIVGKAATTEQ